MKIKTIITAALLLSGIGTLRAEYRGSVTCESKGVAGVVVTNGTDCALTDSDGQFALPERHGDRFIYISTPAGYLSPLTEKVIPRFYLPVVSGDRDYRYDFQLKKNPRDDKHHIVIAQADPQVTSIEEIELYKACLDDTKKDIARIAKNTDLIIFNCGDIVGDSPWLFPASIEAEGILDHPVYHVIGNHDMTYGGRTYETSYSKFEEIFGPIYYSFNKGNVHYIVINNNFYVNRDYQYIGYIDERTFEWMEQDLAHVPEENLIVVVAHIPMSSTEELQWNTLLPDETSNARGLFEMLSGRNAHIITGHSHFNHNVCFSDSLMEHNTAAVCGIWWKADVCVDGTPTGYGVYDFDGNNVKWYYKSYNHPASYQAIAYLPGSEAEYPDDIIANVWNYDKQWKVEWLEDGKVMGEMTRYDGYDPKAKAICADKERVVYDWIYPVTTPHLFRATPKNKDAKIIVRATDRFGNIYEAIPQAL